MDVQPDPEPPDTRPPEGPRAASDPEGWDERAIFAPDVAFEWTVPEAGASDAIEEPENSGPTPPSV